MPRSVQYPVLSLFFLRSFCFLFAFFFFLFKKNKSSTSHLRGARVDRKSLSFCQAFTLGRRCRREGSSSSPADCLLVRRERRFHPQLCASSPRCSRPQCCARAFVGAVSCVKHAGWSRSAAVQVKRAATSAVPAESEAGDAEDRHPSGIMKDPSAIKAPQRAGKGTENYAFVCGNTHLLMLIFIFKNKNKKSASTK